jgi:HAMP domain-containing protein
MRLNTLRNRLVLLVFGVTASAIGFVYLYVVPQLQSSLTAQKLTRLEMQSNQRAASLARALAQGATQSQVSDLVRRIAQESNSRVTLLAVARSNGVPEPSFVIADSIAESSAVLGSYRPASIALANNRVSSGIETLSGQRVGETAAPIYAGGQPRWVAVLSSPLADVADNVALIRRQILIAGGIALAAALLAGWFAARLHERRLAALRMAAEQVAEGDFSHPIPVDTPDELGQLAITFNEMQRRL